MKNIFHKWLLGASLFTVAGLTAQPKTSWVLDGLKGRVKSEFIYGSMEKSNWNKQGFNSRNLGFTLRTEYNENGYVTQKMIFDKKGRLLERYSYTYDDSNYCRKYFHYNESDSVDFYYILFYDNNGNNNKVEVYDKKNSLVLNAFNEYDSAGLMTGKIHYTPAGEKKYQKTMSYENGRLVSSVFILPSQKIPLKFRYEYEKFDSAGNWLKQTIYGTFSSAMEFVFREIEYYN